MNQTDNPFAKTASSNQAASKSSRIGWIVAIPMTIAAIAFLLLWSAAANREQQELGAMQKQLQDVNSNLAGAVSENNSNQEAIAALKSQIADLQKQKDTVAQASKNLEEEMRSQLESKDVTISNLQGKLTVNILDRVMFDSGEAVLKPDGQAVMRKIAAILHEHPQLAIHVVGHTDNVPIRPSAQNRFASNWELSTARALAAVHFLTEQADVDPRRAGAVGYGEFHPVADNSTPEGRAKNRRITITILPNEWADGDAAPAKGSGAGGG